MKVEIATCPCSWGVFWADGTPSNVPYGVFLDQAAQSGYTGLELGPVGYLPTDREALDAELNSRGLKARAGTACLALGDAAGFSELRQHADDLCGLLGSFDVEYLMMMDESDRYVEKPLYLVGVQVHRHHPVYSGGFEQVCHEFAPIDTLGRSFLSCLAQPK